MSKLPKIFDGLADVGAEHAEFELRDPEESDGDIKAWLGALPSDGTRFIVFAQDGTGSLFCLWLRPGHDDVEAAPVVYLGSEGELGVLGKDPAAFLELVASGMTFDGHGGGFFDPLESEDDEEFAAEGKARRAKVAEWVKQRTGKSELREPDAVRAEAEAACPGLEAWVTANNAYR
ncbi:MAG TPA: hypothetical protein VM869_19015 [Enhygromyxa sp.]|nr:hypothetical protein [Enhygromyxa sp.]